MHRKYEFLYWERSSHSSYAQIPLLDWGFGLNIRSPLKALDSGPQYV
jgi:hypothetical protein